MNFLFIFYLIGLLFAVYQDLTRREIDDWLNLFLFFSGVIFLKITFNLFKNSSLFVSFGFFIFVVMLISLAFYYGRIFSGGDSKLLFALSPLFFSSFLDTSLFQFAYFIVLLFICGSVYSLIYSGVLFVKDFKKVKVIFFKELKKRNNLYLLGFAVCIIILGLFEKIFFAFAFLIILFIFLISMAKSLEGVSLKRIVNTKNLREGDWLFYDVKIGKKKFKNSWEGLSSGDLLYLKKFNKDIFVKDGIPYAPSFLLALILWGFKGYFLGIIFS